jgi:hypothetical protein
MILVSVMRDFNVAWHDRDWHFHKQDIAHVPEDLAALLFARGIAREITINQLSQSIILSDGSVKPIPEGVNE